MSAAGGDQELTRDAVFGGAVRVVQRRTGYRFNADALWLVKTALPYARGRVVDLGAGCGVIGLCLARLPAVAEVKLVELQPGLASCARAGVELNQPRCRVDVLEADLRALELAALGGRADVAVANPPYHDPSRGRPATDQEVEHARRTHAGGLVEFVVAAARLLAPDGDLFVVYPARQIDQLFGAATHARLGLRELRFLHARPELPARALLARLRPGVASDVEIRPAWHELGPDGAESVEAARLRDPGFFGEVPGA